MDSCPFIDAIERGPSPFRRSRGSRSYPLRPRQSLNAHERYGCAVELATQPLAPSQADRLLATMEVQAVTLEDDAGR